MTIIILIKVKSAAIYLDTEEINNILKIKYLILTQYWRDKSHNKKLTHFRKKKEHFFLFFYFTSK